MMKIKDLFLLTMVLSGPLLYADESAEPEMIFARGTSTKLNPCNEYLDRESRTDCFNQSVITHIKQMHNDTTCARQIAQNGNSVLSFFQLSNELNLDTKSVYVGIHLLNNIHKKCEIIDDTVVNSIFRELPTLLEHHFDDVAKKTYDQQKLAKEIERTLFFNFTDNFNLFCQTPDIFLTDITKKITEISHSHIQDQKNNFDAYKTRERLRQTLLKFMETLIGRIFWDKYSYESIWPSVMETTHSIFNLANRSIISHSDDLDDLYWTLTHRFCFFLDLAGSSLPLTFYEHVADELLSGSVLFVELGEQDEGIKSKKEVLLEALMHAKTKAFAFENMGILTDQS